MAKIITRDSYEDFQIFIERKRRDLETRNFIVISPHNFEHFQRKMRKLKFPVLDRKTDSKYTKHTNSGNPQHFGVKFAIVF